MPSNRARNINIGQYPSVFGLPFVLAVFGIVVLLISALLAYFTSIYVLSIIIIYLIIAYTISNKYGAYFIKEMRRRHHDAVKSISFIQKVELDLYLSGKNEKKY
jgi:hypothetical protein